MTASQAPVILVHYHLRPGGVTRVIQTQSREFRRRGIPHLIIAGEVPPGGANANLPTAVVPGLDYPEPLIRPRPHELVHKLRAAARRHLGTAADEAIWHFHNHSVGLTRTLTPAIRALAAGGSPIVLHMHDFAEDERPENYQRDRSNEPYFYAPRVHAIVINSSDRQRLIAAGYPATAISLVANAAPSSDRLALPIRDTPLLLYPVRAIRRKNIGEICLLAATAKAHQIPLSIAIGLPADEPENVSYHDSWKRFCAEQDLPVDFAVTDRLAPPDSDDASFQSWLAASTHLITTSVKEGFGLTFLEAQAIGRPLIGRLLPHVARDLISQGAGCGTYYTALHPVLSEQQVKRHHAELRERQRIHHHSYGIPGGERGGMPTQAFDFADLSPELQQEVILAGAKTTAKTKDGERVPLAEWLRHALTVASSPEPIPATFEIGSITDRLGEIYRKIASQQPTTVQTIPRKQLLHQFIDPA